MKSLRKQVRVGTYVRKVEATLDAGELEITVAPVVSQEASEANDDPVQRAKAHVMRSGPDQVAIRFGDADLTLQATVLRKGSTTYVVLGGHTWELIDHEGGSMAAADVDDAKAARSPMTGKIVKVHVAPGDACEKGAPLFVVEAMKMEYVVRAPRDVTVADVRFAEGAQVAQDGDVVLFEETTPEQGA